MTRQFRRTYEITLGDPGETGITIEGNEELNKGLNLRFTITKNINNTTDNDRCSISLVNLSEDSINYISEGSSVIILKVGYNGDNKTIFQGIIQELETDDRTGDVDRVTTFRCLPASNFTYERNISRTFPPESTPRQVLNFIIGNSEGLSRSAFNSDKLDTPIPFGYSVEGSTNTVLKEISRDFGFHWRISGDKLYVNDPDKYEKPDSVETAYVFSPDTGLKGRPVYVRGDGRDLESSENKRRGLKFTSLINPLVKPGSAIQIKDTALEGIYRVNSIEYRGDWRGNSWDAVCTCSKINAQEVNTTNE